MQCYNKQTTVVVNIVIIFNESVNIDQWEWLVKAWVPQPAMSRKSLGPRSRAGLIAYLDISLFFPKPWNLEIREHLQSMVIPWKESRHTLHYVRSRCQCWRRPIQPGVDQGWDKKSNFGPKQINNPQIWAEKSWIEPPKCKKFIPGGDGRVCRIVDGTDGKQEESSADHLEVKLEQTSLEVRPDSAHRPSGEEYIATSVQIQIQIKRERWKNLVNCSVEVWDARTGESHKYTGCCIFPINLYLCSSIERYRDCCIEICCWKKSTL